jgi:hypothetical protein
MYGMMSSSMIDGAPWRQENIKDKKISKMTDRSFKHQPPKHASNGICKASCISVYGVLLWQPPC